MNRNFIEEEILQRSRYETLWMDCAEVDARPFLHYLQYLTYGGLGERNNQLQALGVFESSILDITDDLNLYHPETTLNLLGHCYEMEGDYARALHYYETSLRLFETNNAANWHIRRVLRLVSCKQALKTFYCARY
ncbi:hypothetical protein DPMN_044411 [Dreissena polymorpha]|uniref:Tetratricopeptide repeat protein n=1 Tax=Dreissena polymorpha TaxID=45954 RepID=A0A9D4I0H5_DREPO|nr:hypothetical protein DPMN_044411 [Dreissena polymorpha]